MNWWDDTDVIFLYLILAINCDFQCVHIFVVRGIKEMCFNLLWNVFTVW